MMTSGDNPPNWVESYRAMQARQERWYALIGEYVVLFTHLEFRVHLLVEDLNELIGDPRPARLRAGFTEILNASEEAINLAFEQRPTEKYLVGYAQRWLARARQVGTDRNDIVHSVHYVDGVSGQRLRDVLSSTDPDQLEAWYTGAWPLERLQAAFDRLRAVLGDLSKVIPHRLRSERSSGG